MDEQKVRKIRELIELEKKFSKAYKSVQSLVDKMDATTLNDMRYALRGFTDCVAAFIRDDDEDFEDAYSAAKLALRIAWHDVVDITFDSFRIYLDELGKKYGADIVASHIDVPACYSLLHKVEDLIEESRGDRDKRAELYQKITSKHLKKLIKLFRQAEKSESAIASASLRDKMKTSLMAAAITISLTTLVVIIYSNVFSSEDAEVIAKPPVCTEQADGDCNGDPSNSGG